MVFYEKQAILLLKYLHSFYFYKSFNENQLCSGMVQYGLILSYSHWFSLTDWQLPITTSSRSFFPPYFELCYPHWYLSQVMVVSVVMGGCYLCSNCQIIGHHGYHFYQKEVTIGFFRSPFDHPNTIVLFTVYQYLSDLIV